MKDVTNGKRLKELGYEIIGVYALHKGPDIVYVGQAHCIRSRIGQHMIDPEKDFDGYSFAGLTHILERMNYPTGKKYLDWVEAWEINRSKPEQNRQTPDLTKMEAFMPRELIRFCRIVSDRNGEPIDEDFYDLQNMLRMGQSNQLDTPRTIPR